MECKLFEPVRKILEPFENVFVYMNIFILRSQPFNILIIKFKENNVFFKGARITVPRSIHGGKRLSGCDTVISIFRLTILGENK